MTEGSRPSKAVLSTKYRAATAASSTRQTP